MRNNPLNLAKKAVFGIGLISSLYLGSCAHNEYISRKSQIARMEQVEQEYPPINQYQPINPNVRYHGMGGGVHTLYMNDGTTSTTLAPFPEIKKQSPLDKIGEGVMENVLIEIPFLFIP